MLEQEYEISSPPLSLFSINLSDKYNGEISSNEEFEQEEFSLGYLNEILDNDSTSDVDFENFKNFEENERHDHEAFEKEEIIDHLKNVELTPCVVINFVKGKIQRCEDLTKLRPLYNLFGTWQVDRDAIKEVDGVLPRLGVCDSHFQFDNKYLHKSQNKQLKDFNQGIIQWRQCISCDKYIAYFSQGAGCDIHC
jgi:hypothetical protein